MADTATKRRAALHRLVDELPEPEVDTATRVLEALRATDPVLRSLMSAPYDDEPETEEERQAVAEARAEADRGELIPQEEIERELGLR